MRWVLGAVAIIGAAALYVLLFDEEKALRRCTTCGLDAVAPVGGRGPIRGPTLYSCGKCGSQFRREGDELVTS